MKIKSNVQHNVSFHKVPNCEVKGAPDYMTIPAGSVLELEDGLWLGAYASAAGVSSSILTGDLVIVEDAESPMSADEIAKAIHSATGVTVPKDKSKAELQALASSLSVDVSKAAEVVETVKKDTKVVSKD